MSSDSEVAAPTACRRRLVGWGVGVDLASTSRAASDLGELVTLPESGLSVGSSEPQAMSGIEMNRRAQVSKKTPHSFRFVDNLWKSLYSR